MAASEQCYCLMCNKKNDSVDYCLIRRQKTPKNIPKNVKEPYLAASMKKVITIISLHLVFMEYCIVMK